MGMGFLYVLSEWANPKKERLSWERIERQQDQLGLDKRIHPV